MSYGQSTVGFVPASVLTREELLDHAKHPRNRGALPNAGIVQEETNPLCGDVVTMHAVPDAQRSKLAAVSFTGSGCIISQAAASLLTEHAAGKSFDQIHRLGRSDMEALIQGVVSPSRVKCMMLALIALQKGLRRHAEHP